MSKKINDFIPTRRTAEIAAAVILPVPYAAYKGGEYAARKVRDYLDRSSAPDAEPETA